MNIFDEMLIILKVFYDVAKENLIIEKPLSYALYKTWIVIDRLEKPRKEDSNEFRRSNSALRRGG